MYVKGGSHPKTKDIASPLSNLCTKIFSTRHITLLGQCKVTDLYKYRVTQKFQFFFVSACTRTRPTEMYYMNIGAINLT